MHSKKCDRCGIEILGNTISNGTDEITLCPNHLIGYEVTFESSPKMPCAVCGEDGYHYVTFDKDIDTHLCKKHVHQLIDRNLTPEAFFTLYESFPEAFLLHDDFYDEETGESIQPVPIDRD